MTLASRRKDRLRRIPRWWEAKGPPHRHLLAKRESMEAYDKLRRPLREVVKELGGDTTTYAMMQEFGRSDSDIIETIIEDFNE